MKMRLGEIIFSLVFGICCAYSAACRLFGFLEQSRSDKVITLALLFPAAVILIWFITRRWLFSWLKKIPPQRYLFSILGALLAAGAVFMKLPYYLPPFPGPHELVIWTASEKKPELSGDEVYVIDIKIISLPEKLERVVNRRELIVEGTWDTVNGMWVGTHSNSASLTFRKVFQGGSSISFLTTPHSGLVDVEWDGQRRQINLYSQNNGLKIVDFTSNPPWQKLSLAWKLFVGGLAFAEYLGLSIGFSAIFISSHYFGKGSVPFLLIFAAVVVNLIWISPFVTWGNNYKVSLLKSTKFSSVVTTFRVQNSRSFFAICALFTDMYHDSVLIASPGLLYDNSISEWQLESFGSVKEVITSKENVVLTEEQEQRLLQEPYFTMLKGGKSKRDILFITGSYENGDPLCMVQGEKVVYIASAELIPGCEER